MASPVVHTNMVLGYTDLELKSYRLKTIEESSLFYVTNYPHIVMKQIYTDFLNAQSFQVKKAHADFIRFQWKALVRGHLG